ETWAGGGPGRALRLKKNPRPPGAAPAVAGEPADTPRPRAHAALKATPGVSLTAVAKIAGVSRSTVCNAARELAAEARKQARREAHQARTTPKPAATPLTEPRARAQRFLRDELARGPKQVSAVEAAAARAHVDP